MLGFGAIGVNPVGIGPRGGQTTTTLIVTAGSFALTGQVAAFKASEAAVAGSFALSGVSIAFKVSEAAAPGAFADTGVAATFKITEAATVGAFTFNGQPANEIVLETEGPGSFLLTLQPAALSRTGDQFDLVYGGVGHYLLERERAKQLAKITRKAPPPIDRTTKPAFGSIGSPPIAPAPPAIDLAAVQNQRMAAQMQAAAAAKRRREEEAILLLAS